MFIYAQISNNMVPLYDLSATSFSMYTWGDLSVIKSVITRIILCMYKNMVASYCMAVTIISNLLSIGRGQFTEVRSEDDVLWNYSSPSDYESFTWTTLIRMQELLHLLGLYLNFYKH